MACAYPAYIVKNTFLELYSGSDGELSPVVVRPRFRCQSDDPSLYMRESLLQEGDVDLDGEKMREPLVHFESQSTDEGDDHSDGATVENSSTSDEHIFTVRDAFSCAHPAYIVKNTFLELEEGSDGERSPVVVRPRVRCESDPAAYMREAFLGEGDVELGGYKQERGVSFDSQSTDDDVDSLDSLGATGPRCCSELSCMLLTGGLDAALAIDEVLVRIRELAFDAEGAVLVCQALRLTGIQQMVIGGLRGEVSELSKSPHGHTVLVEAVRSLGAVAVALIVEELLGQGPNALLNGYTCNVICCLLEQAGHDGRTTCLLEHLLSQDAVGVCCHKHGHVVAIALVSFAPAWQALRVVAALRSDVQRLARHRFAHKVVNVVLQKFPPEAYHPLVVQLFATPQAVTTLACHNFGVHLVRTLLQSPLHCRHIAQCLLQNSSRVMKDKYGRQLMFEFGLATAPVAEQ